MTAIEEAREQGRDALVGLAETIATLGRPKTNDEHALEVAVCALLDATEPPAQAEPAEDEREELADLIEDYFDGDCWRGVSSELSSVISAAGYSKGPRPITDEMVEAATFDWLCTRGIYTSLDQVPKQIVASVRDRMRAALEAAMAVNRG